MTNFEGVDVGKVITKLPPTKDKRCGTTAGYKAHRRRNETACKKCKTAGAKYRKIYCFNNVAVTEYQKLYYSKNLLKIKEYQKEYQLENSEKLKLNNKNWVKNNPDRVKITKENFYKNHPEYQKEYKIKNPEKIKLIHDLWVKNNPEKDKDSGRKSERKRRALKFGNGHSPYTEQQVLKKYGTDCHICMKPIDLTAPRKIGVKGWEKGLHIDHKISLSKGGRDDLENVRPTHGLCNMMKGAK